MSGGPIAVVTGGTGAVGPALVSLLCREGYQVRVLARGRRPWPFSDGAVELQQGDVCERSGVAAALAGARYVFHLAGLLHLTPPKPSLSVEYERVNVEGARVVAEEAARAGVSRLVLFSTIAVYGAPGPEGADEDASPRPDSPYGQSKLRGEQAIAALHKSAGLGTSVLRVAAVYGPRVTGNYARLARAIEAGWFVPIGSGQNRRTLVHEADAAEAALIVARSARAVGRTYNVSDGRVHRVCDVIDALCTALGRPAPRLQVPIALARFVAKAGDGVLGLCRWPPRLVPMLDKYGEDVAVRAERIQTELGFHPRFDLAAGWADALRERKG